MDNYIVRKPKKKDPTKYNFYTINDIKIEDKKILKKISKIYIPPAYENVKIFLNQNVLATGIDKAGRKQYVYSENSKKVREVKKYCQLVMLSNNIGKLKNKINSDLLVKTFNKNKIIALILKIMDTCNFRCGNKTYEEKYGSYGLTTLHKKHIKIKKNSIEIKFVGKKGVINDCVIIDENIRNLIKSVYALSSDEDPYVFSIYYRNKRIKVSITDLNKYLNKFNVTTKNLRTWNANIIFLKNYKDELLNNEKPLTLTIKKKLIRESLKKTAVSLHHTPTICKNSYIYKNILQQIEKNDKITNKLLKKNSVVEDILKDILNNKDINKCKNL